MAKTRGARLLAAGALALLVAASAAAAAPDPWITTKAKMALLTTEGVKVNEVNVDTVDGRVTLHGTVGTAAEKAKAEQAVRSIDGVKSVRNLLQVVPPQVQQAAKADDAAVKARVERALKAEPTLDGHVDVASVNAGVVLLKGEVDTLSDHLHAIEVASRADGVQRVVSEIKSPDKLGDAEIYSERGEGTAAAAGNAIKDMWITSDVKMRLIADERTPGLDVNVDTTDGKVTLFGIVSSAAEKKAAEEVAHRVSGVKQVVNALEVVPSTKQEAVKANDDELERRVSRALSDDESLRDASIDVDVENGVARLTGSVPSQEQRIRAAVTARTAGGVRAVKDDLVVKN